MTAGGDTGRRRNNDDRCDVMTAVGRQRLVVQQVVELSALRGRGNRLRMVRAVLEAVARHEMLTYAGWRLGPVAYFAYTRLPAGRIPRSKQHPLEGTEASEATVDALIARLDDTGVGWVLVASAEVIPGG